jgi:hypothetical protein
VLDRGDDIGFLAIGQQKGAIEPATRPFAGAADADLVPHRAAAEQQRKTVEPRGLAQNRTDIAEMECVRRLLDQSHAIKISPRIEPQGDHVVTPVAAASGKTLD